MAACNVPGHVARIEFLRRIYAGKANAPNFHLPLWTKDNKGRGPFLMVLQAYDYKNELQLEIEATACKRCWRRVIFGSLGLNGRRFEAEHPEFASYLGPNWINVDPQWELERKARQQYKEDVRRTLVVLKGIQKSPEAIKALLEGKK